MTEQRVSRNALRILVITSRPLVDGAGQPITLLDVAEERRRIRAALKAANSGVQVHFLPEATTGAVRAVLRAALRDGWDAVHFTGHGTSDGRLVLEDACGVAHVLSQAETVQLFSGCQARMVVLSACHSGAVGQALLNAGIPAVVAVDARVPIADRAAIIFAEHFYAALARGRAVQDAFADAVTTVSLDREVGDARPPLDERGQPETPWSQRYNLHGDGAVTLTRADGATGYTETGAAERPAGNLPQRNTSFVGRAKEIAQLARAFEATSRIALRGPGGLGKTELARAVAWWHAERGRMEAAVWASASRDEGEYKLRDLASLLSIVARALNLPFSEQMKLDEQKQAARDGLAARPTLLLLDNWETIEPRDRLELWQFVLSLPDTVRVIVTSRETLPPRDARNIELNTLTLGDAFQLFVNVARNAGYFDRNPTLSYGESAILSAICDRLSGYPLAVEVVAGQTASRTLADIWADLQRFPQNVLQGVNELTGEPRGVWTSLGFSFDMLPPPERALFCGMSVFLAPALAEDVQAVLGETSEVSALVPRAPDPGGLRPLLDTLVRRSLVRLHEGAYALLPVVRDYAEGKLADSGADPRALHARAVNYYRQKGTLEHAARGSDHLYELATRYDERTAGEAFIEYVREFYQELVTRGYWAEARHKTEQWIIVARTLGNKLAEAQGLGEMGTRYQDVGEYERAEAWHQKSLAIERELGNKRGIASTLHQLGMLAYAQGDYAGAAQQYEQSLSLKRELGDKRGIATTLGQMGQLARAQGRLKEALGHFVQAWAIFEQLHAPYRDLARRDIASIREKVSEAQFNQWVEELSAGGQRMALSTALERINESAGGEAGEPSGDKQQAFEAAMRRNAQTVAQVSAAGSAEDKASVAAQLAEAEQQMRAEGDGETADFFAVLRAWLLGEPGEDVAARVDALAEPFRSIAREYGVGH